MQAAEKIIVPVDRAAEMTAEIHSRPVRTNYFNRLGHWHWDLAAQIRREYRLCPKCRQRTGQCNGQAPQNVPRHNSTPVTAFARMAVFPS
jgi:hypothetical protein